MDKWYTAKGPDILVDIKAVPGASKTEIAGITDTQLRIRIAAAPEEGKANQELISFLANQLCCPKKEVYLVSGEKSRLKRVRIPADKGELFLSLVLTQNK
ncbi:MAG: DUF167 domain-containing protein [Termitinemataceae bacterium]